MVDFRNVFLLLSQCILYFLNQEDFLIRRKKKSINNRFLHFRRQFLSEFDKVKSEKN